MEKADLSVAFWHWHHDRRLYFDICFILLDFLKEGAVLRLGENNDKTKNQTILLKYRFSKSSDLCFKLFWCLILVWPILRIWQGIDFTDHGFGITNAVQFFVEYQNTGFAIWLTNFIHGLWLIISPFPGLLGSRLGGVLVFWITALVSYKTLALLFPEKKLFVSIALFIAMVFINARSSISIHYNSLSILFCLMGIYFFILALSRPKTGLFLFFSGIILGLSIHLRVSNIVGICFYFLVLIGLVLEQKELSLRLSLVWILGYLAGVLSGFILLSFITDISFISQGFEEILGVATKEGGHHNAGSLIRQYWNEFKQLPRSGYKFSIAAFIVTFSTSFWLESKIKSRRYRWLLLIPLFLWTVFLFRFSYSNYINYCRLIYPLLFFLMLLSVCACLGTNFRNMFYVAVFWFPAFFIMAGSGNGLGQARYGLTIFIPFILAQMDCTDYSWARIHLFKKQVFQKSLTLFLLTSLLLSGVIISYRFTYRESAKRLEMHYPVDHHLLRSVFTTKERAKNIQEVLDALSVYVQPGDYLLGYHTVSMLYYLTQTKPYLYNSWPFLYEPDQLKEQLKKACKERKFLPVAVRSKFSLQNFDWPEKTWTNKSSQYKKNLVILDGFLLENNYEKVWENQIFEIFLPATYESTL